MLRYAFIVFFFCSLVGMQEQPAAEQKICSGCLDGISLAVDDERDRAVPGEEIFQCKVPEGVHHWMHQGCVGRWLAARGEHARCPVCRAKVLLPFKPEVVQWIDYARTEVAALPAFIGTSMYDVTRELIIAARSGDINRMRTCIDAGADINGCDEHGQTSLMCALLYSQFDAVLFLLGYPETNVNIADDYGRTVLMRAVYCDYLQLLETLLCRAGTDLTIRDNEGRSLLGWAYGHNEIETLLRERGIA